MANSTQPKKKQNELPLLRSGMTKADIASLAGRTIERVLEEGGAAGMAEALAVMEEFIRTIRADERFVQHLRDELWLHHGQMTTASGARIEACEAGVRYDFSASAEWNAIEREMSLLKEKRAAVEAAMKQLPAGKMVVDPETGEIIEGARRSSKSTYRITLPRGQKQKENDQ